MPAAALDTDEKYSMLVKTYAKLIAKKKKRSALGSIEAACIDMNNNEMGKETADAAAAAANCQIFNNVSDAIEWLTAKHTVKDDVSTTNTNVVITGSLYLVGLALKVLNFKID